MLLQQLAEGLAQDAHTAAMHHSHTRQAGQKCAVHKLLHLTRSVVHSLSNYIDLTWHTRALALE
jgi:hypothetical protein